MATGGGVPRASTSAAGGGPVGGLGPWAAGPGMRASQRLGQRQIDDPPLKDNARAYAHRPESPKGVQSNTMTNLQA